MMVELFIIAVVLMLALVVYHTLSAIRRLESALMLVTSLAAKHMDELYTIANYLLEAQAYANVERKEDSNMYA